MTTASTVRWVGFSVLLTVLPAAPQTHRTSVLSDQLLVTWYGNPHSSRMGILGEGKTEDRPAALRKQAEQYAPFSRQPVLMAYHLVAVVAQCTAGTDKLWRRRESADVIQALLDEARANDFKLILDIQPGKSSVKAEVEAMRPFLELPDVYLAIDPEFTMAECEIPGREIGQLSAADVNVALAALEEMVVRRQLPPKVLILHQFRLDMLPDKSRIGPSPNVDVVLNMDGFGSQALKKSSYRTVMRQGALEFAGIKLFYRQDTNLLTPSQLMSLTPRPSVIIYQ